MRPSPVDPRAITQWVEIHERGSGKPGLHDIVEEEEKQAGLHSWIRKLFIHFVPANHGACFCLKIYKACFVKHLY